MALRTDPMFYKAIKESGVQCLVEWFMTE